MKDDILKSFEIKMLFSSFDPLMKFLHFSSIEQ